MLGIDTHNFAGASLFSNDQPAHPATCSQCGRKTDPDFVSPVYRVRKRRRDATATYDGYFLVSERFKAQCDRERWLGVEFVRLPADPAFFWLRSIRMLEFDAERRETRFKRYCTACRGYCDVIGANPIYLKGISGPLGEGFYRTDLQFASGPEQHPLIIVGPRTGQQIKSQKYPVLDVSPIEI